MDNKNFRIVFIHELGHHIARKLNYSLYNKGAGTKEIYLEEVNANGKQDYTGGTTANIPKDYLDDGEIKDIPQYIAVLLYGCIFQTLYQKKNFRLCFSLDSNANGICDAKAFRSIEKYISGPKRKRIVEYIENEYIPLLSNNSEHLNLVLDLKFEDLIQKEESVYYLKLETLDNSIAYFLNQHSIYYELFIKNILDIKN